ncbi:OLC1v1014329C1 [Oldenlandia corymbosa var. corymbosa]|uniref:OLC1v1014329C1 n=1 Tax=Oldenlandia corymbosa var. corymbosa TaxID=529605 RepID=A0AAV1E0T2_OLDCO|nr:OLC1v1014329C1 [Oldenlandia corymbosa var. corymbosa]
MEPWEALDIDDSDIPSLLRPCKRLHRQENPISISTASPAGPFLRPCSRRSSPTLVVEEDQQEPSEPKRRIIPGPAGAVQSAMLQKARDREKENILGSESIHFNPVSTQEYIRRAVEDVPEFDDDFSGNPWLSALQFIGTVDGVVPSVPLSSFSECGNFGKVDRVVAVIKSRAPIILGGLMVTLKDPTGTIGAAVHHKLLSESQFSQDFVIGSVLILEKVATFSPSKSVYYLNITPKNLVKVFKKDDLSTEHQTRAHSVKYVAPREEFAEKVGSPEKMMVPEGSFEVLDGMEQPIDDRQRLESNHHSQKGDQVPECLTGSSRCTLNDNIVGKEPSILSQDAGEGLVEETLSEKAGDQHVFSQGIDRGPKAGIPKKRFRDEAAKCLTADHVEIQEDCRNEKQKKPFTASLPLWTDEQLEELFAGHDEDDRSFF